MCKSPNLKNVAIAKESAEISTRMILVDSEGKTFYNELPRKKKATKESTLKKQKPKMDDKIVVLGLGNRDYHYSNIVKFEENGTYIVITFYLKQNPSQLIIAKHPVKQIAGWTQGRKADKK